MRSLWARRQYGHVVGASLVGAPRYSGANPGLLGHPAVQQAIAAAAGVGMAPPQPLSGTMPYSGTSPSFSPSQPSQLRKWVLGFGSSTVSASATANLTTAPQTWFRPDRLVVPSGQATNFLINDVKIGNRSQLLNVNAINASMFIETAVDSMVTFDTADPAVTITITVQNTDTTASHAIAPSMIGASAY